MREALLRAELSRRETLEALQDFNSQLETLLATHRSQRAWKVMLWLRKAYTLLFRKSKTALLASWRQRRSPEEDRWKHTNRSFRLLTCIYPGISMTRSPPRR